MWYRDVDGDGYGNNIDILTSCVQPQDYVSNNLDCNDGNDSVYETTNDAIAMGFPQIWIVMMVYKISVVV